MKKCIYTTILALCLCISCPAFLYASDNKGNYESPSVNKIMQEMADKAFKNVKPEDLPYLNNNKYADCNKFVTSATKKLTRLEDLIIELGEAKKAGKVGIWEKIKAVNALRILLSYAVVDRMFASKSCVDAFDETALTRIDKLIEYYK